MSGLRTRLESIQGVSGIELELGDDGLEGITVRLQEGADEAEVLNGVRRLLVAYGTKPSRMLESLHADKAEVDGESEIREDFQHSGIEHEVLDVEHVQSEIIDETDPLSAEVEEAEMFLTREQRAQLSVTPAGDRSTAQVVYSLGERTLSRQVPSSARAIVQAVLDMAAELAGREPISVIGVNLSAIEGVRVLTVIAGNEGANLRVSTVSVMDSNWPVALLQVASQILESDSG